MNTKLSGNESYLNSDREVSAELRPLAESNGEHELEECSTRMKRGRGREVGRLCTAQERTAMSDSNNRFTEERAENWYLLARNRLTTSSFTVTEFFKRLNEYS
jgi:hypothetical protein